MTRQIVMTHLTARIRGENGLKIEHYNKIDHKCELREDGKQKFVTRTSIKLLRCAMVDIFAHCQIDEIQEPSGALLWMNGDAEDKHGPYIDKVHVLEKGRCSSTF